MAHALKLSPAVQQLLRCPVCTQKLESNGSCFRCTNRACRTHFPIVNGVPILINEAASIFSIDQAMRHCAARYPSQTASLKRSLRRITPSISKNIKAQQNFQRFADLLQQRPGVPTVLVIGSGEMGQGIDALMARSAIEVIESDVGCWPRAALACDAHDIPFEDGAFDGVVAQAVLEHVVDPYRCVQEIHRVLKDDGLIYAETPFMQQVHGRYDFTRFTHLGHRRLFRTFAEIDSGASCGPGMALAWSYQYFLLSFPRSRTTRALVRVLARLTSFYLKYLDTYLINRPGALDAASGYFFLGQKTSEVLSDRDVIKLFRGYGG